MCIRDRGNYSADVEEGTYQLLVKIGLAAKNNFNDVESLLNRVVPQNMVVTLLPVSYTHLDVYKRQGVTSPLQSMHKAMGVVLNTFEAMQQASGRAVDTAAIREAREEWAKRCV